MRETLPGAVILVGLTMMVVAVGFQFGTWWGLGLGGLLTAFIGYAGIRD
jgi:protein-S-isoprenylcysteine O-methyltransferase Ste14